MWNQSGKHICQFYKDTEGKKIKFVERDGTGNFYNGSYGQIFEICFVIDATSSMNAEIVKARESVRKITSDSTFANKFYKVILYEDHCDEDLIRKFPNGDGFTNDSSEIINWLGAQSVHGGGDYPEAALDGIAHASQLTKWSKDRNKLILHIYDAPPHGDFPNHNSHCSHSSGTHCCCCNPKCEFNWPDVIKSLTL